MEEKRTHNDKKVVIAGILAAVLSITIAAVLLMQSASAQTNSTQYNQMTSQLPQINGSVNIQQQANKFVQDNVKVPFNTASSTAQSQVDGGTVIGGHLGVAQGYLVYIFNVANFDAGTSHIVIVDAGNGQVLYTSEALPLHYGGLGGGFGGCHDGEGWHHHGGYGMNWSGQNKSMMSPSTSSDENGASTVQTTGV